MSVLKLTNIIISYFFRLKNNTKNLVFLCPCISKESIGVKYLNTTALKSKLLPTHKLGVLLWVKYLNTTALKSKELCVLQNAATTDAESDSKMQNFAVDHIILKSIQDSLYSQFSNFMQSLQ